MDRNDSNFSGFYSPLHGLGSPNRDLIPEAVQNEVDIFHRHTESLETAFVNVHRRSYSLTGGYSNPFEGVPLFRYGVCNADKSNAGRPALKSDTDIGSPPPCNMFLRSPPATMYPDHLPPPPSFRVPPPSPITPGTPSPFERARIGSNDSDYVSPARFENLYPLNTSLADEFARLFPRSQGSGTGFEVSSIDEFRKIGKDSEYLPDEGVEEDPVDDVFKASSNAVSPFVRQIPKMKSKKPEAKECVFCKNNGELEATYKSHILKDKFNKVQCPILRKYVCPHCGESGDNAHTKKYCEKRKKEDMDECSPEPPSNRNSPLLRGIEKLRRCSNS